MNKTPPKLPLRFFRWFCHPDYVEDIEGDLLERFEKRPSRWRFALELVKLLRPGIIRSLKVYHMNSNTLFKHNALMAIRVLKKERAYSVINILGLALGFASFLAIYQFDTYEKSFDQFHTKADRIFRITSNFSIENSERRYLASTPPRIAPFASQHIPEIENYARLDDYYTAGHGDLTISTGKKKFRESKVCFANPSFLELFSFPLLKGEKNSCLSDLRAIVLTESMAKKYFAEVDPIGQLLTVDGASEPYTITGVLRDVPSNSHIQFDFLISYKTLNWWYEGEAESHWTNHEFYSYLLLKEGADPSLVEKKINDYYLTERGEYNRSKNFDLNFTLQPLKDIHFNPDFEQEIATANNVNPTIINIIFSIGLLTFIIAFINYINISTARSLRRKVELNVRKTLGASRSELVSLFILESLATNVLALILASTILIALRAPLQNILGFEMNITLFHSFLSDPRILVILIATSIFIGVYPVFVLRKIYPRDGTIVKFRAGHNSWVLRGVVTFQFCISIALLIGTLIIYNQITFMRTSDIGFEKQHKLVVRGANQVSEDSDSLFQIKHKRFIDRLSEYSYVNSITTANKVPGEPVVDPGAIHVKGFEQMEDQTIDISSVGLNYFKTLEIELMAGRTFERSSDLDFSVILNRSATQLLGFQNPDSILNKKLILNSKYELNVIGVVEDYNHISSRYSIEPLIFYCDSEYIHYYVVDYNGDVDKLLEKAEAIMAELFPRDPFEVFFLDDHYNVQYQTDEKLGKTILLSSCLAIIIACLGLVGLASHNAFRRLKEIGIRKTFGANAMNVLILLNKETIWLLLIANVITWPVMHELMSKYLDGFAARIQPGVNTFLFAGGIMATIAVLSISFITLKAALANPAEVLKDE